MNAFTILEAIDAISDQTLLCTLSYRPRVIRAAKKQKSCKKHWVPWAAAAACLCLIVVGAIGLMLKGLQAPSDFVIENNVLISYTGSESNVVLPDNVTAIANGAFCDNQTLQSISAPKVTSIGDRAFENCTALQSASFFEALEIGDYAFSGCRNLEELGISCATTVGQGFIDGTSIEVLMIPEVTEVLNEFTFTDPRPELWGYPNSPLQTFAEQYGFTFVNINETAQAFGDFTYLEFPDHIRICRYTGTSTDVVIPEQINAKPVTELRYQFISMTDFINPAEVTFSEITSLCAPTVQRLVIESDNTEYYRHYFYHNLTLLDMPMLTDLPDNAFSECVSLSEIRLDSMQSIGSYVFRCGQFTELYVPNATRIAPDAFAQTDIRTLHGYVNSYVESWAKQNGYGFVDIEDDYVPDYEITELDPSSLIYHPITQSGYNNVAYGYTGVGVAHDDAGTLYLHVRDWDAYLKTPFKQYYYYSYDTIYMPLHTAAVYGDTAYLVAGTSPSTGDSPVVSSLAMASITLDGEVKTWTVELGQKLEIRGMSLHFSDERNGKLLITHTQLIDHHLLLLQTNDGGLTWNAVQSDSLPVSYGGAKLAPDFCAYGFVTDQIGFASIHYYYDPIEPEGHTYLTFDGGKTWRKWNYQTTEAEIPDGYGETIALIQTDGVLYLTVQVQGGSIQNPYYLIYKSSDNGASWQPCQ